MHSLPFYRDMLGMPEVPLDDADGAAIAGLAAGESLVELLEARSDDSPIGKFVAKRGPGIHHVCFAVDDLDGTLERCRTGGCAAHRRDTTASGRKGNASRSCIRRPPAACSSNCPNTSHGSDQNQRSGLHVTYPPMRQVVPGAHERWRLPQVQNSRNGSISTISTNHRFSGPRMVVNDVTASAVLERNRTRKSCLPPATSRGRSSAKPHAS